MFLEQRIPGSPFSKPRNSLNRPSTGVRLTSNQTPSLQAHIALDPTDNQHIVVAYADFDASSNHQVYIRESFNRGTSWGAARAITSSTVGAWHPSIVIDDSGTLHVAYVDHDIPNGDIFVVTIDSGGMASAAVNMSNTPELSAEPSIVLTETQGPVLIWTEENNIVTGAKLP